MTFLTPASRAALARLRAFRPGPTRYLTLPLARRAAVLVLLYADRQGELRVVLTIRSAALRSYAGQAALPGGKADTVEESAFATARREACEEIGLPMTDQRLPTGYSVEHLTELPCNLAITELGVKPCVAYIHAPGQGTRIGSDDGGEDRAADPARDLLPRLEVKEVAALFTAPFRNFLHEEDADPRDRDVDGEWHLCSGRSWLDEAWRVQQFFVPVTRGRVVRGCHVEDAGKEASAEVRQQNGDDGDLPLHMRQDPRAAKTPSPMVDPLKQTRYRVFGLTADILVDCARVAYDQQPDFAYKQAIGDEDLVGRLQQMGKLGPVRGKKDLLTRELMVKASKL